MTTVAQLLRAKPPGVISISPDAVVLDAIKLLAEKGVGSVLVMKGSRLLGIISERDYARKLILMGKSSADTPVVDVMTQDVIVVAPTHSAMECMVLMNTKKIRHLPVMEDGQVVGVLSIRDLLKNAISEQQTVIDQLTNYTDPKK